MQAVGMKLATVTVPRSARVGANGEICTVNRSDSRRVKIQAILLSSARATLGASPKKPQPRRGCVPIRPIRPIRPNRKSKIKNPIRPIHQIRPVGPAPSLLNRHPSGGPGGAASFSNPIDTSTIGPSNSSSASSPPPPSPPPTLVGRVPRHGVPALPPRRLPAPAMEPTPDNQIHPPTPGQDSPPRPPHPPAPDRVAPHPAEKRQPWL